MFKVVAVFLNGSFTSGPLPHGEAIRQACDIVMRTGNVHNVWIESV